MIMRLLIISLLLGASSAQASGTDIGPELRRLGFSPLSGDEAPAFTLPKLDTQSAGLESTRGKWTLLVFWATWCGACAQEMPVLETLHEGFAPKGLAILAVATDDGSPDKVRDYATSRHLSFPILLDSSSKVAAIYRASSIPTNYLITPKGRLAGIARGVPPWNDPQADAAWAALLAVQNPALDEASVAPARDGPVALASDIGPPEMVLKAPTKPFQVGRAGQIDLEIHWQGEASRYLIKVPRVTLPDRAKLVNIASSTDSQSGSAALTYQFHIQFSEPGTYAVGPIELAFSSRDGGQEQFARLAGSEIVVAAPFYRKWQVMSGAGLGLALLGSVMGIMVTRTRRAKQRSGVAHAQPEAEEIENRYRALLRQKQEGNFQAYAIGLIELSSSISILTENNAAATETLERVKFAGLVLNDAELKIYERKIEKRIAERESQ